VSERKARDLRTSKEKGTDGEDIAVEFLREKGYGILQRNFRIRSGEVDIIAVAGETIVICEVKAWKTFPVESLEYALSADKRRRIIRAASLYLRDNPVYDRYHVRFDVIHVDTGAGGEIRHVEGAFDGD
jgi:putative endonuclease